LSSRARSCVVLGQHSGPVLGRRSSHGVRPHRGLSHSNLPREVRVGTVATDVPIARPRVWSEFRETRSIGVRRASLVNRHVHHFAPQPFWTDVRIVACVSSGGFSCATSRIYLMIPLKYFRVRRDENRDGQEAGELGLVGERRAYRLPVADGVSLADISGEMLTAERLTRTS